MDMLEVKLTADRQQGMTIALLDVALADAARGANVIYKCDNPALVQHSFRYARELATGPNVSSIRSANGDGRIHYTGGGRVRFVWRIDPFERVDMVVVDSSSGGSILRDPVWGLQAADAARRMMAVRNA